MAPSNNALLSKASPRVSWVWQAVLGLMILGSGTLATAAPSSLELFATGGDTSATGPVLDPQINTFYLNANNPNDNVNTNFIPDTKVTLSLSNQQHSTALGRTTTGAPNGFALMFGGEGNSNSDNVAAATIFVPMNTKGTPPNSVFTATANTPAGQGIDGSLNYGTRFYVSNEPLQRGGYSRTGRHYMGDITITFNRPVRQPVIQIAGLGGRSSSGLGFSAEFDLSTAGLTLSQLSGSSEFSVSSTQIRNSASILGAYTGSGGASGSVVVNGGNVTSLTFKVYLRGDGQGDYWDGAGVSSGDAFVFSAGSMDAGMDLSIAKTQRLGTTGTFGTSNVTVPLNAPMQYRLVITNNGPQYVTDASYTDVLPSALKNPSVVGTPVATGNATCPVPTFAGNTLSGSMTGPFDSSCTVTVQVEGGNNADIVNTATVSPPNGITDLNTTNNSTSVNTRVGTGAPQTDVRISKTDGLDAIAQGAVNTYRIRVTNFGANPVTGIKLRDPVASGLTKTNTPACTSAAGNVCTGSTLPSNANLESGGGYALPTLPANGGFYEINVEATVGNVTTITNTATVDVRSTYQNTGTSCYTNNGVIRDYDSATGICSSTDTTQVNAANALSFDSAVKEARLSITPNVPTIWRGGIGQQTIIIKNNGPDTANNTFATYSEAAQTGVSVTSVTLANGTTACGVSGAAPNRVWTCPLGTLANGASSSFLVNYSTTMSASLGNGLKQGVVRAGSDEFNPGSGVSESVFRIWGAEGKQTAPSKYGAFMVGYTGTGGDVTGSRNGDFGTYSYEGSSIVGAWPTTQDSPTGGYLNYGISGANNSNYLASSSTAAATIQRLTTTVGNISISLPREDTATNSTDNRRAWELKTGALLPTGSSSQTVQLCIGNSNQKIDDSGYIMVNGVVQGAARDTWINDIYTVSVTLNAGFNLITYRIANRNSTNGVGGEVNAGGFGTIGVFDGSNCLPNGLNALASIGEDAKINIIDAAALVITKTNSTGMVNASGQTIYTLTVENQGPSTVTGAILKDPAATHMTKNTPVCSTVANNLCTPTTTPTAGALEGTAGYILPTLASGQKYVLNIPVTLNAGNVLSVANSASVTAPTGVTALGTGCVDDPANGYVRSFSGSTCTATDTDQIRAQVIIRKTSTGGVGAFEFGFTNSSETNDTLTTVTAGKPVTGTLPHPAEVHGQAMAITETLAAGYVLTSVSCVDANASLTGNPASNVAVRNGNTVTIPASNIKAGANFTCSFVNAMTVTVSGTVFNDNSGSTGSASNAYNGTQESGEQGLAGVTIRLTDCASTVVATTQTNASGQYLLQIPTGFPSGNVCVTESNLPGYQSVSGGVNGSSGYTLSTDTITFANAGVASYSNLNFGDVRPNLVLTLDGQSSIAAGRSATYAHTLSAETPLTVTLSSSDNAQPAMSWSQVTYVDSNCNGVIDSGESRQSGPLSLMPGRGVCLIDQVQSPANAPVGAQYVVSYDATGTATVQGGSTLTATSSTRRDTTLIGGAQGGLIMDKKVRTVASCPSTSSDTGSFVSSNSAKNGDRLEYQIVYRNAGNTNLTQVAIKDSVPVGTLFGSASCVSTPTGNTCTIVTAPASNGHGPLHWNIGSQIKPSQSGEVRFCVRVPPLP